MRVDRAARASSWEGGDEGELLAVRGLALMAELGTLEQGVIQEGGAMERGDWFEVDGREVCRAGSVVLRGEISISSGGESRVADAIDWGRCFEVAESGEQSEEINGTVCRRRNAPVGAKGGRRAIF